MYIHVCYLYLLKATTFIKIKVSTLILSIRILFPSCCCGKCNVKMYVEKDNVYCSA